MSTKKGKFSQKAKKILKNDNIGSIADFLNDDFDEKKIIDMKIESIKENPYQPRTIFDEKALLELSESIKQSGVIQPIIIRKEENDFFLIAGERRLRASKLAKRKTIPALISTGNPMEISLIENLQRENLKPIEEAEALKKIIDKYDYTQERLAKIVGKGRTTISEILSLNKLTEDIKNECRHADISKRVLIEVAKQKSEKSMKSLFNKIVKDKLKSDEVRKIYRAKNKEKKNTIMPAIKKIISTYKALEKVNFESISEEEQHYLKKEFGNLKEVIEGIIN